MAFRLLKDPMDTEAEFHDVSSLAVVVGDLLVQAVGATTWTAASSTSNHFLPKMVATETVTSSATEVKGILVNLYQLWDADYNAASSDSHDGDRMILTDENTVNNTGSDSNSQAAVWRQKKRIGPTADNRASGYFLGGQGVDPDDT